MIEIRQPELEALIMERLQTGAFENVEEVLYQALRQAPMPQKTAPPALTSAEFLAAFRSSPFKEIDLQPESFIAAISDPLKFQMFDLLDTNFLSELRKPRPNQLVMAYSLSRLPQEFLVSTVTLAEIGFGIHSQPDQAKREALNDWLERKIRPMFADRVVPVSEAVILRWRILLEQGRKSGRVFSQPDLIIAATAIEHGLTLVTRNTKDFADLPDLRLLNPWEPRT